MKKTTSTIVYLQLPKGRYSLLKGNRVQIIVLVIMFMLFYACDKNDLYMNELHDAIEEESVFFNTELQPFAAWMRAPSTSLRSSIAPETEELIKHEKELFEARYSYVREFLKIDPYLQWEAYKMVQYDNDNIDIFVPCINVFPEKIEQNDYVLVISKRGENVFSILKMLPRDESLSDRISVYNHDDKVYLEVKHTEPDGVVISQRVGYIIRAKADTGSKTRSGGCPGDLDEKIGSITIRLNGDRYEVSIITADNSLICDGGGGSGFVDPVDPPIPGYVNTPGAGQGASSVPPYSPPASSGSGGSSGNSGSSNNGGSGSSGGVYFGGSGNPNSGSSGGTDNFDGGGNSNYNQPEFPEGGLDIIPMPEYEGTSEKTIQISIKLSQLIESHSLTDTQLNKLDIALNELINEGCMQKALYNTLVEKNVKIIFGMATNSSAPASFDPRNRYIKFRDNSSITKDNLKEELFHAWQDTYYTGGIWQYRETGKVNIEFEAKVFKDIIESPDAYCCWAFYDADEYPKNLSDKYLNWIYDIRESKISLQDTDYQNFLILFNQYNSEYSSPMHENLSTPNAIKSLINQSNCF